LELYKTIRPRDPYRIPDLQLDGLIIQLYGPRAEFHPDGHVVHVLKPFVGKLEQEAALTWAKNTVIYSAKHRYARAGEGDGLTDTSVSDNDILEQIGVTHEIEQSLYAR